MHLYTGTVIIFMWFTISIIVDTITQRYIEIYIHTHSKLFLIELNKQKTNFIFVVKVMYTKMFGIFTV